MPHGAAEFEFDILVYATGVDAITGAYDRMDFQGTERQKLRDEWKDGPVTYLGMSIAGYPNMLTVAGPQSGSAATDFPRGIEVGVDWATQLLQYAWKHGFTRFEAMPAAEERWTRHVADMYTTVLMRKAKGWFTGCNSNVEGHEYGKVRHLVYHSGAPKYVSVVGKVAADGYSGFDFA